jgi:hypothetical protein
LLTAQFATYHLPKILHQHQVAADSIDHPDLAATLNAFVQLLRETKSKSQAEALTSRAKSTAAASRPKQAAATQTVDVRDLNFEVKVSRRSFERIKTGADQQQQACNRNLHLLSP